MTFAKISSEDTIYKTAYFLSYTAVIIQESEFKLYFKTSF